MSKHNPAHDYLKYWKVVRYFVKAKYKINTADLDMLLFLYSERYFSKSQFKEFNELLSWDINRFSRLLRDGWISVFRKRQGNKKTLYELSYKGKRMISSIYSKLNGEEIPMDRSNNPMYAKNVSYSDKVYKNFITDMNKYIREQRQHHSQK
jgi:hypothetical protein|tara:strand:- start:75 stop:527 length:453 start_codon:yes stop_codon:yes gene_type:complete